MTRTLKTMSVTHDVAGEVEIEYIYQRTGQQKNYIELHRINKVTPLVYEAWFKAELEDLCLDILDSKEEIENDSFI